MKSTEMLELLREFYRDKVALRQRHLSSAQVVSDYNFNNSYQYVIAREDMHVRWLADAVTDLSGRNEDVAADDAIEPRATGRDAQQSALKTDSADAGRFIEGWRRRIEALPNARHRTMLNVILGETLEHKRFFDLALAGRNDLLGRRADGAGTGNGVMGERWVGDITK